MAFLPPKNPVWKTDRYVRLILNKMKPTPTDHDLISGGLIYGLDRTLCDSTKVPIGPPTPSFASSQMEGLI